MKIALPRVLLALVPILAALADSAHATDPVFRKLYARFAIDPSLNLAGTSVAVSDQYVLVGEPNHSEVVGQAGAVHVFSATTGRYLRKLTASDGDGNHRFGSSVSISGTMALIGAPFDGLAGDGKAYVFDLKTGRQKLILAQTDATGGDRFGSAVAIDGDRALVGAVDHNLSTGAAYLFDTVTGAQLQKFEPSPAQSGSRFGSCVALCDRLAIIGAPYQSEAASRDGAVFVFDTLLNELVNYLFDSAATDDMRFGQSVAASAGYVLIGSPDDGEAASSAGAVWMIDLVGAHAPLKFFSPAPTANGEFGNAVALSGNLALIGDPNADPLGANEGRADLFVVDGETATPLRNLLPAEVRAFDFVGSAVALCGSGAAIGAPGDDSSGFSAGAAYHVKNLSGPLPFDSVARKGDTAPGAIDAEFNLFKQPAINSQGAVSFTASLTGPGSNRNRDTGGWIKTPGLAPIEPVVKSRDMLDALGAGFAATKANAILSTNWDTAPGAFFETTLTGPGVTSSNNRVIIAGNLDDDRIFETVPLLRTGDPLAALGGAMVKSFAEIASAIDPIVAYTLKTGDAGVTTANDTGLLAVDAGGSGIVSAFREGDSDSFGVWGQFFGRVSATATQFVSGASLVRPGEMTPVSALFSSAATQAEVFTGKAEYGGSGATFRSLTGEAAGAVSKTILFKATLTGAGVTSLNNEGLYLDQNGAGLLLLRKGDEVDPVHQPGVTVSRFLKFWPFNGGAFALVKLRGTGVKSSNDCALLGCAVSGPSVTVRQLIREGDSACQCDGAKVGSIQSVEVSPGGAYAVLASLTGSRAANQALFAGRASAIALTDAQALTRPFLLFRKGGSYQGAAGDTTTVKSISLPALTDRFGVGGKGAARVMDSVGRYTAIVTFTNRAQELVSGDFLYVAP